MANTANIPVIRQHLESLEGMASLSYWRTSPIKQDSLDSELWLNHGVANLQAVNQIVSCVENGDAQRLFEWFFLVELPLSSVVVGTTETDFYANPHNITYIEWLPSHGPSEPSESQDKSFQFIWDLFPMEFRGRFQEATIEFLGSPQKIKEAYLNRYRPIQLMAGTINRYRGDKCYTTIGGFPFNQFERLDFEKVQRAVLDMLVGEFDERIKDDSGRLLSRLIRTSIYPVQIQKSDAGPCLLRASMDLAERGDPLLYANFFNQEVPYHLKRLAAEGLGKAVENVDDALKSNFLLSLPYILYGKHILPNPDNVFTSENENAVFLERRTYSREIEEIGTFLYFSSNGRYGILRAGKDNPEIWHSPHLTYPTTFSENLTDLSPEITAWIKSKFSS